MFWMRLYADEGIQSLYAYFMKLNLGDKQKLATWEVWATKISYDTANIKVIKVRMERARIKTSHLSQPLE